MPISHNCPESPQRFHLSLIAHTLALSRFALKISRSRPGRQADCCCLMICALRISNAPSPVSRPEWGQDTYLYTPHWTGRRLRCCRCGQRRAVTQALRQYVFSVCLCVCVHLAVQIRSCFVQMMCLRDR